MPLEVVGLIEKQATWDGSKSGLTYIDTDDHTIYATPLYVESHNLCHGSVNLYVASTCVAPSAALRRVASLLGGDAMPSSRLPRVFVSSPISSFYEEKMGSLSFNRQSRFLTHSGVVVRAALRSIEIASRHSLYNLTLNVSLLLAAIDNYYSLVTLHIRGDICLRFIRTQYRRLIDLNQYSLRLHRSFSPINLIYETCRGNRRCPFLKRSNDSIDSRQRRASSEQHPAMQRIH
jgi:hypothetical protein